MSSSLSKRGLRLRLFSASSCRIDLSPMIDLVFLLLIFFMVSSTLITYRKDPNVKIPVASDGKVPGNVRNRIILNVYEDGTVKRDSGEAISLEQVETLMRAEKEADPRVKLHVRADRVAAHAKVKEVIDASARGGVVNVIFSTYITDH
ncbi:MAG: biopolymer transporter ExbD [Verrucomicrobiae bacterium]|nr:biopolymer transporter ExbD [Verrucomicrobiae bacterium]